MKDLMLMDNDKNLQFSNLDLAFTPDFPTYVSQKLRIILEMIEGEYFLDSTLGIPWFSKVMVKNPNVDAISSVFKAAIMGEGDVSEINSFSLQIDRANRNLQINFSVTLTDGSTLNMVV